MFASFGRFLWVCAKLLAVSTAAAAFVIEFRDALPTLQG